MQESAGKGRLSGLGEALSSSAFRKSFFADPHGALSRTGLKAEDLPEEVLDALSDLTPEELRALARVRDAVHQAVGAGKLELADGGEII